METSKMSNGLKQSEYSEPARPGQEEIYDYIHLSDLPKFAELNDKVQHIVRSSSIWDLYGVDLAVLLTAILTVFPSLILMRSDNPFSVGLGMVMLGICHAVLSSKGSHLSTHGALSRSTKFNRLLAVFLLELCGSFSEELGMGIHIKVHHPHTNIIGLGDSSTWKAPFCPRFVYMFMGPLLLPILTPLVAISGLWNQWGKLVRYLLVASVGLFINFFLLMNVSNFTIQGAVVCTLTARALLSIPYIHVNIFQHIGLPMYSQKSRPVRIYQMATGCLNLPRNLLLDICFGHSLISCHVEHHLFPKLSDNMCLKIKPVVSKFLRMRGLPYNEDSYVGRLQLFLGKYDEWMVKAPPITHFVGIQ